MFDVLTTSSITPSSERLRLLDALNSIEPYKFFPFGGVFRDDALGIPINDVDVRFGFDENAIPLDQSMGEYLLERFSRGQILTGVKEKELILKGDTSLQFRFQAFFEGVELDLIAENCPCSINTILKNTDAPINAAVLCPETGHLITHHLFGNHVQDRIYAPFTHTRNADERFAHLSQKIPGLSLDEGLQPSAAYTSAIDQLTLVPDGFN